MLGSLRLRGCLAVLASCACARAAAAEPACELAVRTGALAAPWIRAIDALRAELADRLDIDHCADLHVAPSAGGATIVVTSGGRSAARAVETPEDLRAAIIALLVIPPSSRPSARLPRVEIELPAPLPELPRASEPGVAVEGAEPRATIVARATPSTAWIDLRMAGGAAWSGSRLGTTVTAAASRARGGWIVSAIGRWERGRQETGDHPAPNAPVSAPLPPHEDSLQSIGFGVELGRELRLGSFAIAVAVGPAYAHLSQRVSYFMPSDVPRADDAPMKLEAAGDRVHRTANVLRFTGSVRATMRASTRIAPFIELGAGHDVGSETEDTTAAREVPGLPTRSMTVLVGFQLWSRR